MVKVKSHKRSRRKFAKDYRVVVCKECGHRNKFPYDLNKTSSPFFVSILDTDFFYHLGFCEECGRGELNGESESALSKETCSLRHLRGKSR